MSNNPVEVEPVDPGKKTSEILGPMSEEPTVKLTSQHQQCYWNDAEFSHGNQVILDGKCYECSYGNWLEVDD